MAKKKKRSNSRFKKWNAAKFTSNAKTGKEKMSDLGTPLRIHKYLTRTQSSLATQIRSEHIGVRSYLYWRKVLGIESPKCPYGYPSQNIKHMIMSCPQWAKGRGEVCKKAKERSFEAMLNCLEDISRRTKWILQERWFEQFRVVREIEAISTTRAWKLFKSGQWWGPRAA